MSDVKYKYKELITILCNKPEGAVFWDGEDYLDLDFCKRHTAVRYCNNPETGKPNVSESHHWDRKDPINTGKLSRLSDLKEIMVLMGSRDRLVQDLNDIYYSPPAGAFPRTDSDFKRVGQDLLNLINRLEKQYE